MTKEERELKGFIVNILRRATFKWRPRSKVMNAAKLERGIYSCNICKNKIKYKEVTVDHIIPVIDPQVGWVDFNTYINRMFVREPGWQVLCKECHDAKTKEENSTRQLTKEKE